MTSTAATSARRARANMAATLFVKCKGGAHGLPCVVLASILLIYPPPSNEAMPAKFVSRSGSSLKDAASCDLAIVGPHGVRRSSVHAPSFVAFGVLLCCIVYYWNYNNNLGSFCFVCLLLLLF